MGGWIDGQKARTLVPYQQQQISMYTLSNLWTNYHTPSAVVHMPAHACACARTYIPLPQQLASNPLWDYGKKLAEGHDIRKKMSRII